MRAILESAITNNIPEAVARKHQSTRENMFTEWVERFRAHAPTRCAFTIDPNFTPKTRVRDNWDSVGQLVKEISPEVY